jgi:hypothetical protein
MVRLEDTEKNVASLDIEAAKISSRLEDAEGNINSINATATGYYARIESAEGNITSLAATAENLSGQISSLDGSMASIQATANALTAKVSDAEKNIAALTLTAQSLSSEIKAVDTGVGTKISQSINGISLSAENGEGNSSTLKLMYNGTELSSQSITFNGFVTFTDLSTSGKTTIHGGNLSTKTVNATAIYGGVLSGVEVSGVNVYGSKYFNAGKKTWMEVGKDLDGIDNDAYALYVSNTTHKETGIFSVFNGDEYWVTLGAKGYSFLRIDGSSGSVQIPVGKNGKYWELTSSGIRFKDKTDAVISYVQLTQA